MKTKWTCEQANKWYSEIGWRRGCNFIGSDCANRLDMWQKHLSEEKLETADRELELCHKIGFNTVSDTVIHTVESMADAALATELGDIIACDRQARAVAEAYIKENLVC